MKVIGKKVETFQNEAFCDKCGDKMIYVGMAPMRYDPFDTRCSCSRSISSLAYEYECKRCGLVETSYCTFPYITYKEIENEGSN